MKFYKMQGIGNDYIYFDCFKGELKNPEKTAVALSDRHFGIGGDGIILLMPSKIADVKMRMFNADGSEGKMCGNGIRCLGKLARDLGYVSGNGCTVETLSGIKQLEFFFDGVGKVERVRVDMGKAETLVSEIPALLPVERAINYPLENYNVTLVSMGNPHCVIFTDPDNSDIEKIGKTFENHKAFPDRINTEFVKLVGENHLKMRVWERGSGETLACGTGACASAYAASLLGLCNKDMPITVSLLGGDLVIELKDRVFMTGEATLTFIGETP